MIKCNDWPIAVCTWSLHNNFDLVNRLAEKTHISHIHLAVGPALAKDGDKYLSRIEKEGWQITAAMLDFPAEDYTTLESIKKTAGITPDDCWPENRKRFVDGLNVCADLGIKYMAIHLGFLDHSDREYFKKFEYRTKVFADAAHDRSMMLLAETGQESAEKLREFLEYLDHPAIGVNFDPANIILYDKGNPVESLKTLSPWIRHIHIKDAVRTKVPGTWGQEVPWGDGEVNTAGFLDALRRVGFRGALAIEREQGDARVEDMTLAAHRLLDYGS